MNVPITDPQPEIIGPDRYMHAFPSPLGEIICVSDGAFLTGLWFAGQKHFPRELIASLPEAELPVFAETARWLQEYFDHRIPFAAPPLMLHGTAFQNRVWNLLKHIPYGSTASYGSLARILAEETGKQTMSAQAVGRAVGANPVSLIIPCHRIIGRNGELTGYAGGLERKARLLEMEQETLERQKQQR